MDLAPLTCMHFCTGHPFSPLCFFCQRWPLPYCCAAHARSIGFGLVFYLAVSLVLAGRFLIARCSVLGSVRGASTFCIAGSLAEPWVFLWSRFLANLKDHPETQSNKSLDASGGSVFRIIIDPAMVE